MKYSVFCDYNRVNVGKWQKFLDNNEYGTLFQTPDFYKVYSYSSKTKPLIICCENTESDEIEGILLSILYREHSGILGYFSARSVIWGGPVVKDDNNEIVKLLLSAYLREIKGKVIYTEIRNLKDRRNLKETLNSYKFKYIEHLNILIDLSVGEETLWKNLKRQRKEGIRKAQRNNFVFKAEDETFKIKTFYGLLERSYKRINVPFPELEFFVRMSQNFSNEKVKYFTLSYNKEIIIALCALINKKCIYAYYIGITDDKVILNKRPVDLFYWELILYSYNQGISLFDWLGAGKPARESGVRKFKLEYGGELVEYGRFLNIHKPLLMKFSSFALFLIGKMKSLLK